ncbi:M23 family metallopeptidase [Acinetobacter larvae]|uniref:Peptidase M23 n=1 Tax=Acinetobacter larvae TaxID=1789224 RepID=A0A1B2LVL2_9GAMM|nr:M23 family metallopeptidase [Acinetobacter larvae]AOA56944.1 peptidase M23 [Acinetobacter larvae]
MHKLVTISLISLSCILLNACSTAPKKTKQPAPISSDQAARLKAMPMPKRLAIPVANVNPQQLTDTWGSARSQGRRHEGIDIMANRGTKVYSTTDGIIASLKGNNLGGTVIWILGPAGSWHYYAHLNAQHRDLKEGAYIKKGTLIGYVGNTGNARHTAPHLHYGIYLDGKGRGAVNPYPYLR